MIAFVENLAERNIDAILNILTDVQQRYRLNEDIYKEANDEIQDILHDIELSKPKNARDGYACYKALREARIRRRQAKEENEILKGLYDFTQTQNTLASKLAQIKGDSRKIVVKQQNQVYSARVPNNPVIPDIQQQTEGKWGKSR